MVVSQAFPGLKSFNVGCTIYATYLALILEILLTFYEEKINVYIMGMGIFKVYPHKQFASSPRPTLIKLKKKNVYSMLTSLFLVSKFHVPLCYLKKNKIIFPYSPFFAEKKFGFPLKSLHFPSGVYIDQFVMCTNSRWCSPSRCTFARPQATTTSLSPLRGSCRGLKARSFSKDYTDDTTVYAFCTIISSYMCMD